MRTLGAPELAAIPNALKVLPQWVTWKKEERKGKLTKVPYSPNGGLASTVDPSTWATYDEAVAAYERGGYSGIGWVFTEAAGIVGVDLDHICDPATGQIEPWAQTIIDRLNSYTEVSPSGTGLHVFVKGALPPGRRRKRQVEIYSTARYFTTTGAHLPGTPTEIQSRQAELAAVHAEYLESQASPAVSERHDRKARQSRTRPEAGSPPAAPAEARRGGGHQFVLDGEVKAPQKFRALYANNPKFALTYNGQRPDFADQSPSAFDLSLASFAVQAGWTGQEIVNLLIQFRRERGHELKLRQDYYERTLAKARESAATAKDQASPRGLPIIDVTAYGLPRATTEAWTALEAANEPPTLFRLGDMLVRLERDDAGRPLTRELEVDRLRHELARAADWTITRKRPTPTRPPLDVVRDLLADPEPRLPRLTRVVTVPTFTGDGRLLVQPGYDRASGLYLDPEPGLIVPEIPATPSVEAVQTARDALLEVIADFPFVDDADRAHAVALALLPFVRDLVTGPTPAHLIESPTPGSGKGLLVDALLRLSVGRRLGSTAECRDDDEWRKRLAALLKAGLPVVHLDNVTRPLASGVLALALTQDTLDERLLGRSETLHLPIRCIWVITGNNITLSTELARRCIRIRLDPKVDQPWRLDHFHHANLREWVDAERGRLIGACLVLIRAWLAAGRPAAPKAVAGRPLGSYEAWRRVLGGILWHAGVPGFLDNLDAFYEATDLEGAAWREFIEAAHAQFGTRRVKTADLLPIARDTEGFPLYGEEGRGRQTALGRALMSNRDRVFGSLRLVHTGEAHGVARWQILPVGGGRGDLEDLGGLSHTPPTRVNAPQLRLYRGSGEVPPSPPSPPSPVVPRADAPAIRGAAGLGGADQGPATAPDGAEEPPEPGSFDGPEPVGGPVSAAITAAPTRRG